MDIKIEVANWKAPLRILRLGGRLDIHTTHMLRAALTPQQADEPYRWAIDLKDLEYISSAGIGNFIALYQAMKAKGGQICFFGVQEHVMHVFTSLGLEKSFDFFDNEEAAKAAY